MPSGTGVFYRAGDDALLLWLWWYDSNNDHENLRWISHQIPPSSSRGTAVGFDIEWRVSHQAGQAQRPTALIQICNSENKCYLFHIATMFGKFQAAASIPVGQRN